ncbi:MAG: 4Fe-4S binding protein, partial [Myxococcales bacterium]|nr:4Fe-4S binding protein [Myxococcales bacterium]
WLLCANSKGINVWCAAGGGHLTDHDVIAVLRSSGVAERVVHRDLILPQLAATGVERRRVAERTGWRPRWGPARLEDLPAFLDRGRGVHKEERFMRFPLWERLEMGTMWALPTATIAGVVLGLLGGWRLGVVVAVVVTAVISAIFAAIARVPIWGSRRWWTFGGGAVGGFALGAGLLALWGAASPFTLGLLGTACVVAMGVLSVDLAGTTPWWPSYVNTDANRYDLELLEDRCTGAAECVLVCPRDVLAMDGHRRKVAIVHGDACIRCGACIVQCPEDALRFRFADGRVVEPETVRRTKLNLLGRRTVAVEGTRNL